jgi:hypothetical protein
MGLVVIVALGLYLLISIAVVSGAANYAKSRGKNAINWGFGAALVMFLIPFWDWIPTVVMYKYDCSTEAGFWVYKTSEQWKKENPRVMETLTENNLRVVREGKKGGFTDTYYINPRFNKIVKEYRASPVLPIYRLEQEFVDTKDASVLARYVDFWTGYVDGWEYVKFWMTVNKRCNESGKNLQQNTYELRKQFVELEKLLSGVEK